MLDSVRCSAPARDKDVSLDNCLLGPESGQIPGQDNDTRLLFFFCLLILETF